MTMIPSSAEYALPRPPKRLVPPITAAAIALRLTSPVPACCRRLARGRQARRRQQAAERSQAGTQHERREANPFDVDTDTPRGFAIAADREHRAPPAGTGERVVEDHHEQHEESEHPRHSAPQIEVPNRELECDGQRGDFGEQHTARLDAQAHGTAPSGRPRACQQHDDSWQQRHEVRQPVRHDHQLPELHKRGCVGKVDRSGIAQQVKLHTQQCEQSRQRRHEAGHANPVQQRRVDRADQRAAGHGRQDGDGQRHAHVHPHHADDR
jgi:hypothetical protein